MMFSSISQHYHPPPLYQSSSELAILRLADADAEYPARNELFNVKLYNPHSVHRDSYTLIKPSPLQIHDRRPQKLAGLSMAISPGLLFASYFGAVAD